MSKTASRPAPHSPLPGASRRAEFSASTRQALVDAAEDLFAEHGYAATSLDAIVAEAGVTKGALYHHYSGKQALFEAVFEEVESASARSIQVSLEGHEDPWQRVLSGLHAFLEVVRQPSYSRIVIQDGPSVLGYERFREHEERSTFAYVLDIVGAVLGAGDWNLDPALQVTLARIFFGAMSASGVSVSASEDAAGEAERVEVAIAFILSGLRALAQEGEAWTTWRSPSGPRRGYFFVNVTLPPLIGTSSTQV
jgi:AcrR family transcriptional regulator